MAYGDKIPAPKPSVPESGKWSTAEQNKLRDSLSKSVATKGITTEKHEIKAGDTLGAVVFAYEKAYKKNGTDLGLSYNSKVEYNFKDAKGNKKLETGKLHEANKLSIGDVVTFRKEGDEVIVVINGEASGKKAPDVPISGGSKKAPDVPISGGSKKAPDVPISGGSKKAPDVPISGGSKKAPDVPISGGKKAPDVPISGGKKAPDVPLDDTSKKAPDTPVSDDSDETLDVPLSAA